MTEVRSAPRVEFLWWAGCPSWERALGRLRESMSGLGLDPETIEVREIHDEAEAAREGFAGSPTVRIGGVDIRPPRTDEPFGLTCRVYRRRDGAFSPLPDAEDVRDALEHASRPVRR